MLFTPAVVPGGIDDHDRAQQARGVGRCEGLASELAAERSKPEWQTFNLNLNDEQREVRDWAHEFAASVIRPAASEWDEREETPWPVIQEAAKIGL